MKKNNKKLLTLFATFFRIGLFTFGGGYAMIPLMEKEIVYNHGWIEKEKFIDAIAITQAVPGAVAVNLAVFFGYNIAGIIGALVATIAVSLPSFFIILLIAIGFQRYNQYPLVIKIFKGVRPAVVGLIAYAGLNLARHVNWSISLSVIIIVTVFSGIFLNVNPIFLIVLSIVFGFIVYKKGYRKRKQQVIKELQN